MNKRKFCIILQIMRCGFCDCFGPFLSHRKKDNLDEPLDQNTLNRCLELVQAHEARQDILLKVNFIYWLLMKGKERKKKDDLLQNILY